MTTIDWIMGATTVLAVLRQLWDRCQRSLHRPGPVSLVKAEPKATFDRLAESLPRLAFLAWLYYVTDGAAFSPFDLVGRSAWRSGLAVLGLG